MGVKDLQDIVNNKIIHLNLNGYIIHLGKKNKKMK